MVGIVLLLRTKLGKRFAIATVLSEELEEAPCEELRIGGGSLGREVEVVSSSTRWNAFQRSFLAGGFNPFEKYQSNWIISTGMSKNTRYLKLPTSF